VFEPARAEDNEELEDDILELTDEMVAEDEPADEFFEETELEPEPFSFAPPPRMVDRSSDEGTESILAPPVQEAGTTAIAELARAVARERGIGLGTGGLTLEDLVRDILKTLIKDWLDHNLPYMIERIVKKEIERMVNRAEKL
jgi:cell pole-organizing protein PopZ